MKQAGAPLILRPTSLLKYEDCAYAYKLSEIDKVRSVATAAALPFGTAVHKGVLAYVEADARGDTSQVDPVQIFEHTWDEALAGKIVRFSSHDEPELREIGKKLCKQFPEAWGDLGLKALISVDGKVLVENRLRMMLDSNTVLSCEPDVIAANRQNQTVVPDAKTPASKAFEGFAIRSDQLTAYNLAVNTHAKRLGIKPVEKVAFHEGLKQKSARWVYQEAPARTTAEQADYVRKAQDIAQRIRSGIFPKRSAAAYNSPCSLCDFANFCMHGNREGLLFPKNQESEPHKALLKVA